MDTRFHIPRDLESLSANTEDSLLNTRNSSETNSLSKDSRTDEKYCKEKRNCRCPCCLTTGVILTTIGILMLIWTPFEIMMRERLRMLPGLPAFEWWVIPPEEVILRAYLYNVTNSESFLNGTDEKMNIEEIGPIIYREKLIHKNITFNNNGTLSYVAKRTAVYLPEMNTIDLNATMIVPNFAVLGMASYLHDSSFFTKLGFNLMLRSVNSPIFVKTTPYNYMWNFTDPILNAGQKIYPSLVPFLNMGMLERIYADFEDSATVYIGVDNGNDKFFLLDKYHGSPYILGHDDSCPDLVVNSTEGVLYPQNLTKKSVLRYWRKTLCRVVNLYYEEELPNFSNHGVKAYKYRMPKSAYDRKSDISMDCYTGNPKMPDGLSDVSKCYDNIPMAASFPHFLYREENFENNRVTGLTPNETQHGSFAIVEPVTGIPIEAYARSQSNLVIRKLSGFHPKLQRFSDTVLPMFWLEYNQVGLPNYVSNLMYFTVILLPKYQYYFISFIISLGAVIIVLNLKKYVIYKNRFSYNCNISNLQFERQQFLKNTS